MNVKRILVLINLAAKRTPAELAATARAVLSAVQANLDQTEAVFTSTVAFGLVGVTSMECGELHRALNKAMALRSGDNLSVLELGVMVISTHPGLRSWASGTQMVAVLSQSALQK